MVFSLPNNFLHKFLHPPRCILTIFTNNHLFWMNMASSGATDTIWPLFALYFFIFSVFTQRLFITLMYIKLIVDVWNSLRTFSFRIMFASDFFSSQTCGSKTTRLMTSYTKMAVWGKWDSENDNYFLTFECFIFVRQQ